MMDIARERSIANALSNLEEVMRIQSEGYQRLMVALERKREAIRIAELERVPEIAEVEGKIVDRLAELDVQRGTQVAALAEALGIAAEGVTISLICKQLNQEDAARLAALAVQLRTRLEKTRKESSIIRAAGDALARHMAGVVQSVTGALSGTGIYGSRGQIATGVALARGLDVRS